MRTLSRLCPTSRAVVCTAALAFGMLACSRSEHSSSTSPAASTAQNTPLVASAAAAVPPSASDAPNAEAQAIASAAPAQHVGGAPLFGQPTNPEGTIRMVRGEELATHLRTTGARGTIVNIWASWCGPCRRELPMLLGLQTSLAAQGIEVVFVSVDEPESEQAALSFFREQGGAAPIYVSEHPLGPFKQALTPRWRGMLPATFLFDAQGALRYLWGGPVYDTELLPIVDGFLAGKNIDGESNFGLAPGQDGRH